jgi:hypothetical protein
MNKKKPPLTPPKGRTGKTDKNMKRSNKYSLIQSPPAGELGGFWRAATRNPVEALRYE